MAGTGGAGASRRGWAQAAGRTVRWRAARSSGRSTRPARSARDESARPPGLACIVAALALPALIAAADERAQLRILEFFAVALRHPLTRRDSLDRKRGESGIGVSVLVEIGGRQFA